MSQAHPNNRSQWLEPPNDADPVHEWGHLRCPDCGDMPLETHTQHCPLCARYIDGGECTDGEPLHDCGCIDEPHEADDE